MGSFLAPLVNTYGHNAVSSMAMKVSDSQIDLSWMDKISFEIERDSTVIDTLAENGIEFDDWFLPSKNELNDIYNKLKKNNVGDFDTAIYWSSAEYDSIYAWPFLIGDGLPASED
ncbi:MAG: hypothetical protein K9L68_11400 [Spirochaetales bacterium]|nr:hypothetical protein [Spirochaetales bacterium]MCF7939193.1 hypothetical protein [Spirochaetales bacterium]MCF7949978.1 hypothetical protein [Spirochaetia bacterium]